MTVDDILPIYFIPLDDFTPVDDFVTAYGFIPVDDVFLVQVSQAASDLRCIEDGPLLREARVAHVVDVELEVSPVHDGQHQAQRLLRLKGIRQAHLSHHTI